MPGHVLIAGASGVIGRAAVARFDQEGWQVTAISRRDPDLACHYRHLSLDLTDGRACGEAVRSIKEVTHLVYAALFEEQDLVSGWRSQHQMETNLSMLRHLVEPLVQETSLEHVSIFQGTKAYGVHLRPFPVPARESWPRHDHANFYWLQEDYLREQSRQHGFSTTVWRPQVVFGDALGAAMNVLPVIGAYAALEARGGRALSWPGGPPYVLEAVDTRLIARALAWAADAEGARDETFNITNGDVFVWQNVWPAIAEALGMEAGADSQQMLGDTMAGRAEEWRALCQEHGLACADLNVLMGRSHHYADFTFATGAKRSPAPVIVSTIKLRQAGFSGCIDTEEMFRDHIRALQDQRVLPAPGELRTGRRP